jgi:hypothetical protein
MERLLETAKTQALRESGVIRQSEIIKIVGDICIAEDVISGARRILSDITEATINSQGRRVLRD